MMTGQILGMCLLLASQVYQVPPHALIAMMHVEGGKIGQAVGPNQNGSYDLGPMQVNTRWVPELAKIWQVDEATALSRVRDNGCVNVHVAAWILRQRVNDTGSLYQGIAAYHSYTPMYGNPYVLKVVATMRRLGLVRPKSEVQTADNSAAAAAPSVAVPQTP